MATDIRIMNPRVTLPTIRKDASDNFEQAIICVSDNNVLNLTLTFNPPTHPTHLDKPMEWDELQDKINNGHPPKSMRGNQVAFFYGFRKNNSCYVEIRFYDGSIICIEDKDISGLP